MAITNATIVYDLIFVGDVQDAYRHYVINAPSLSHGARATRKHLLRLMTPALAETVYIQGASLAEARDT